MVASGHQGACYSLVKPPAVLYGAGAISIWRVLARRSLVPFLWAAYFHRPEKSSENPSDKKQNKRKGKEGKEKSIVIRATWRMFLVSP